MTIDPFAAPRQHLARAESRLTELRARTETFFDARPYRVHVAPHEALTGHNVYRFRLVQPVPRRIKRLARQTARALHRALDTLGPAATLAAGGQPARRGNRFPFAASAAGLRAAVNECCWGITAEVIELFMASQPHPGGDDLLHALHQICGLPRRRFLVPEVSARMVLAMDGKTHTHPAALHAPEWDPARREVTILHNDPDALFQGKAQVQFYFAFGDLPALRGDSAVALLAALTAKVAAIVEAAERCVSPPVAEPGAEPPQRGTAAG